ncbi:hypothetical protein KDW_28910 [Dictyobacter vulcani]|uniref:Uncharacterized protein n=1 Tax=Dictyobacter vulcani TaxID=2607529 RepID=A0A5J4KRG1_9CHLR|nr:hypothetical protein KDW_28910 [Dictyobacter vulcani]
MDQRPACNQVVECIGQARGGIIRIRVCTHTEEGIKDNLTHYPQYTGSHERKHEEKRALHHTETTQRKATIQAKVAQIKAERPSTPYKTAPGGRFIRNTGNCIVLWLYIGNCR